LLQCTPPSARLIFAIFGFLWVAFRKAIPCSAWLGKAPPPESGAIIYYCDLRGSESELTSAISSERFLLSLRHGGQLENSMPTLIEIATKKLSDCNGLNEKRLKKRQAIPALAAVKPESGAQ
jgi:hypothetical protein